MALTRRKGWIRLGVVFSIIWILGVAIDTGVDYHYVSEEIQRSVETPNPQGWQTVGLETFVLNCGVRDNKESICHLRLLNLVLLLFAPIAATWAIVVALIYVIGWVRAGFRDEP